MQKVFSLRLGYLVYLCAVFMCSSCISQKKMIYLQESENYSDSPQQIDQKYQLTIQPDDQLSIAIASKDEELILPFNTKTYLGMGSKGSSAAATQGGLSYFQVDSDGYIDFPILGELMVKGKTRKELATMIEKMLFEGNHIKDPQVTVKIMSFKITVLGEVKNPGVQNLTGERMTILEAIGMAGDLLPTAKRKNIKVLREENGERKTYKVDLTNNMQVLNSPVYYLQQNDVVYVEPNKTVGIKGSSTLNSMTTFGGIIAMVLSMVSVIISLSK